MCTSSTGSQKMSRSPKRSKASCHFCFRIWFASSFWCSFRSSRFIWCTRSSSRSSTLKKEDNMRSKRGIHWLIAGVGAFLTSGAIAQEVVLKVHHFLPPQATIQAKFFNPWCEKINKESNGRLKCQIYPAMQLGGTPPQLFDQARDGVADIIWTIPTYQAGRFLKAEVFELPFMAKNAETGSPALWDYVQKNAMDEFKGVKILALHVHDGSLLHFSNK